MKILGIGIDLVHNSKMKGYIQQSYTDLLISKFLHWEEIRFVNTIEIEKQKV